MRLTDHHREINNVLAMHGIRPEIEETGGGHIRFTWTAGGKPQALITAKTPSDWRATKNEVARVRRMLKDAGVKVETEPIKQATPTPPPHSLEARVAQLERDIQMLMDRLTRPDEPQEKQSQPMPPPPDQQPVRKKRGRAVDHENYWLWRALRYDEFLPVAKIAKDGGKTQAATSVALTYWKKRGYVHHRPHVGWRKHSKVEELKRASRMMLAA